MRRSFWYYIASGVLIAIAASSEVLSAFDITVPWVVSVVAVIAAVATFVGGLLQGRADKVKEARDTHQQALTEATVTPSSGKLPKVKQWTNPLDWGVHTAAAASNHKAPDKPPPYVPRDIDDELRRCLAKSGFVLLVGDSTAGKTRSAYEAVSATLPEHTLIIPTRTGISAALKSVRGDVQGSTLFQGDQIAVEDVSGGAY